MMRSGLAGTVLLLSGCVPMQIFNPPETPTQIVPTDPFQPPTPPKASPPWQANYAPASQEISLWVDYVGRKLVAANRQMAMKPLFAVIGTTDQEMFHQGTDIVYVTAGLVKACKKESQLAALLSYELGKAVAERWALSPLEAGTLPEQIRSKVPVNEKAKDASAHKDAWTELVQWVKNEPEALVLPDPRELAKVYLERTGYARADFETVAPLLRAAERSNTWERQLKGLPPANQWLP
jgi:hypothetical protein